VTGGFERCQCQIKFVTKKGKTFIYLVTIRYSAADYLEMIIIFEECEANAREAAFIFSFAIHCNSYLCIKGIMKMFMFEGNQFKRSRAARPESF
jgi:hypothetical protein